MEASLPWLFWGVSLDVVVLALALVSLAAALVACFQEASLAAGTAKPSTPKQLESSQDIEEVSPISLQSPLSEKAAKIPQDVKSKVREDLPEPEPEGCDEDARRKHLEVCLERLPGEAWGFAWHSKAFAEQRLIIVGVDPNSPAGRWQLERKHEGLRAVERGDELICANDLCQHSSMQISLVVANKLCLRFLRAEGVAKLAGGLEPVPMSGFAEAPKEEVNKDPQLPPEILAEDNDLADDLDETGKESLTYDGVPRNFWSYQRLPLRPPTPAVAVCSETPSTDADAVPQRSENVVRDAPRLRAKSDPPAVPRRGGGEGSSSPAARPGIGSTPLSRGRRGGPGPRSPTGPVRSPQSAMGSRPGSALPMQQSDAVGADKDSQIFSGGSGSENASRSDQCPSTDWEYMMDNRPQLQQRQSLQDAQGQVVLLALGPMLGGVLGPPPAPLVPVPPCSSPHVSDAASTPPPPLTSPKVPGMPSGPGMPGAGLILPVNVSQAFPANGMPQAANPQVMGWAPAWPAAAQPASASSNWMDCRMEEGVPTSANARPGKKTYRAGQRLTARRLRAAQRAAELSQVPGPGPCASPRSASSASEEDPVPAHGTDLAEGRSKPRRRAGVRVRRRREHAIARRREQEEQDPDATRAPPAGAVPPGPVPRRPEEENLDHDLDAQSVDPGSPTSAHQTRPTKRLHTRTGDLSKAPNNRQPPPPPESERDVIGREVLINGLVHTPHLNGHWGRVADFEPERGRYLVHAFVAGSPPLPLRLRREAFVVPKTNPPSPDELVETWQPSLRM